MTLKMVKDRCVEIGECWEWASPIKGRRRMNPELRVNGEQVSARRYAYEQAKAPVRDGFVVTAKCGNPYCVNPAHAIQVTRRQLCVKSSEEGRLSGSSIRRTEAARARAKLTLEQAREIRSSPETATALALKYGIDLSAVKRIRRGDLWKEHSNPFAGLFAGLAANDSRGKRAA